MSGDALQGKFPANGRPAAKGLQIKRLLGRPRFEAGLGMWTAGTRTMPCSGQPARRRAETTESPAGPRSHTWCNTGCCSVMSWEPSLRTLCDRSHSSICEGTGVPKLAPRSRVGRLRALRALEG